jgi:hypothetical protein
MTVNLSCAAAGHLVAASAADEPVVETVRGPSRWFPGRYRASVREECDRYCVQVVIRTPSMDADSAHQPEHHHFDFDTSSLLSKQAARVTAEQFLGELAQKHAITVNDWRFTDAAAPHTVEMRLDAPGSMHAKGTTTFSARHFPEVNRFFWGAEDHNGAFRVIRITDMHVMQMEVYRAHCACANPLTAVKEPYLHRFLKSGIGAQFSVIHTDGNMLNNVDSNLTEVAIPVTSTNTSQCTSDEDDASHASPSHHSRKRARVRHATLNSNNHTGISGMSMSKDGSRYYVKVRTQDRGDVRKSFNVRGAKQLGNNSTAIDGVPSYGDRDADESLMLEMDLRRIDTFDHAVDFLALNSVVAPSSSSSSSPSLAAASAHL